MASKHQLTGMLGVYLAAAELTRHDLIVSTTSRSAAGADLLATTLDCSKAWSIQIKTNRNPANFWLMNANSDKHGHETHIYVFANIRGEARPDFLVVPSLEVKDNLLIETSSKGSVWYSFPRTKIELREGDSPWVSEGWSSVFGESIPESEVAATSKEMSTIIDGRITDEGLYDEMLNDEEANALADHLAAKTARELGFDEDFIARNIGPR